MMVLIFLAYYFPMRVFGVNFIEDNISAKNINIKLDKL